MLCTRLWQAGNPDTSLPWRLPIAVGVQLRHFRRRLSGTVRSQEEKMKRMFVPLVLAAIAIPTLSYADLPPDVAKAVAAMGHKNDAAATHKIFDPLQPKDPVTVAGLKAD